MKERSIIFGSEMVKAILEGRKTQTRRVVKPQPSAGVRFSPFVPGQVEDGHGAEMRCPYAVDRLWVRETWGYWGSIHTPEWVIYRADGDKSGTKWKSPIFMPRWANRITLEVTNVRAERLQAISEDDARAEGVEFDVWDQALVARKYDKDGAWFQVWTSEIENYSSYDTIAQDSFRTLWDSINAKRGYGWDSNPWVWVIEFERVTT